MAIYFFPYLVMFLLLGGVLYFISSLLYYTVAPRYLFAIGCFLAVYLLYLTACAAIMTPGFFVYVLPFFGRLNANGLGTLIQGVGGLSLLIWGTWAMCYCRLQGQA